MGEAEVAAVEEKPADSCLGSADESVVWSQEVEVCLFHAMLGHKPVGVNRHFHMICIRDKFSQNIGRQVSSRVIWDHLSTMYDMQALHESEILPFPNSEKTFVLPEEIIQDVKEGKLGSEDDMKEEFKEERDPPATHEEGLGPCMAGQDFERYGQKNTFALFQNSDLTITDQLLTRSLCRATAESTDRVRLSLLPLSPLHLLLVRATRPACWSSPVMDCGCLGVREPVLGVLFVASLLTSGVCSFRP
ncbi:MRG/MORF4L-binding protein isoform X1 [Denticeps clupeoides]|uniref:MRG/MORF4L-binding protein isoform X1 n=1 Tax=Denticeps clupeoides TaxID=299321 RepID=UPI0010A48648|nr:MRG/MORF4L-binding protein isoform X1 [Denticeps clupeoides]